MAVLRKIETDINLSCKKFVFIIIISLTLCLFLSDVPSLAQSSLQQISVDSCVKKKPTCSNGKKAFCSDKSFRPKCFPGRIPDCCKKISRNGLERALKCNPGLLKCPN